MTELEMLIRDLVETEGPMRLDRYMALCLGHPRHGYYMARDPFGEDGDFITAPEVSQIFGELVGLWCTTAWQAIGAPAPVNLIELGPGRGTLMTDILRAGRVVAGFGEAVQLHLVETSPTLRVRQARTIGPEARWHDGLETVPEGPFVLVANEFFDAIPIRQFEFRDGQWFERCIGLGEGKLAIGLNPLFLRSIGTAGTSKGPLSAELASDPSRLAALAPQDEGCQTILEDHQQRNAMATEIGARLAGGKGAALIIDYGHAKSSPGDTLQAVRKHRQINILDSPGEADLTAHVDFDALGKALAGAGAAVAPPITQRQFLLAMGLEVRAQKLAAAAPAQRLQIERAVERLAGEAEMGNLFKVIAAASPSVAIPYPFGGT